MKLAAVLIIEFCLIFSACSPRPVSMQITVYFTNRDRFSVGTEPYEVPVSRTVPAIQSAPEMVLTQMFLGPTAQERSHGLEVVLSGTSGYSKLTIDQGVARVYLTGECNSRGATYTIGNLITANLAQFPEIHWIKIYDQNGETENPSGQSSSIPLCLEP